MKTNKYNGYPVKRPGFEYNITLAKTPMNATQRQLLYILADGKLYSGEMLGKQLNMSRAGIWKIIQQLNRLGIDIKANRGNGYYIPQGLDLLKKDEIFATIDQHYQALLDDLIILEEVDSTNTYLLQHTNSKQCLACLAEYQTHGKGRRGRHWAGAFAQNIYCSLLWHFNKDPAEIIGLSLAIAVSVMRALQNYGIYQQLGLKWPNDIMHAGKKLGGILVEIFAESHHHCSVVIGVGLNTRPSAQQGMEIPQPWTQLEAIIQKPVERNRLAGLLLTHMLIALTQFAEQGLTPFIDEWNQFNYLADKPITIISGEQQHHGKMAGISAKGELILIDEQQKQHFFLSGEASLRPRLTATTV